MIKPEKITKKQFIINFLLIILYNLYLISYSLQSAYILLSKISEIILFLFYFLTFLFSINNKNKRKLLLFTIVSLLIASGIFFTNYGVGSILNILNMFLFLYIVDEIKITKTNVSIIKITLPIYYILFILSDHSFLNTNFVGYIYLLYFMLFNNLYNLSEKKIFKLMINILLLYITLYYGNMYQCRTSQIVSIFIFITQHLKKDIYKSDMIKRILPYLLTIGSIISAYVYVSMWKNNFSVDLTAFASKKLFSGRNMIWNECFDLILTHPFFGVGGNYALKSHFTYALHNSMLMIITTYGIPLFIVFVYEFRSFIYNMYEKYKEKQNFYLIIISLFSIFFVDYFESYFYWSVFNYVSLINLLLCIYKINISKKI